MFFNKADNDLVNLDLRSEVREALVYEYRYKSLIERVQFEQYDFRILFISEWYQELIATIREGSLTHDREYFDSLDVSIDNKKNLYAQLLVYRFDHDISILDDLNFEMSKEFIDQCQEQLKEHTYPITHKTQQQKLQEAKALKKAYDSKIDDEEENQLVKRKYSLLLFNFLDEEFYYPIKLTEKEEEQQALYYEDNYKNILSLYAQHDYITRIKCLKVFGQELLNSLSATTIVDDQKAFTSQRFFMQDDLYVRLLIYRNDHQISILEDLHFEKTLDFIQKTEIHLMNWYDDLREIQRNEIEYEIEKKYFEYEDRIEPHSLNVNNLELRENKLEEMRNNFLRKYDDLI